MVGIFQMFGFSFLFWVLMGCIRFIFEVIEDMWKSSSHPSASNFFIACTAGVALTSAILFLFFANFDAQGLTPADPNFLLPAVIVWAFAVLLGTYFAVRLYGREPNTVIGVLAITSLALGSMLFSYSEAGAYFSPHELLTWAMWMFVTAVASFIGGEVAIYLNTVEHEEDNIRQKIAEQVRVRVDEIAVVIAAYNEELTIGATIGSLLKNTSKEHIYVGSDGSKDKTVEVVRSIGCNILDLQPNGGKARALSRIIHENNLLDRYKVIYLVDADIKVGEGAMAWMAAQFEDPTVAAVINRTNPLWPKHYLPRWRYFFTAYRLRLWLLLRYCLRYGQTWKYMNVSPIIPGGGSMYRSRVIREIQIDVPGLIIEDFNMTFCVHHQKLGRISFVPGGPFNVDQEPFSLRDYVKQIYRWYLGYFQTVRHHGPWFSWFFISNALFNIEMVLSSLLVLVAPFILITSFATGLSLGPSIFPHSPAATILTIAGSFFLLDYIITVLIAVFNRRPLMLVYGFAFPLLRYVECLIFIYTLGIGLFTRPKTDGRWVSPKRVSYVTNDTKKITSAVQ